MALLSEWNFGFVTLPSRPGSFTKRRGSGSRNLKRKKREKGKSVHVPSRVNPCKPEPPGFRNDELMERVPSVILSFSQTNSRSGELIIRI